MASRAEHRPMIIRAAKKTVRGVAHEHDVFGIDAHAAEDSEDTLHVQRRFHKALIEQIGKIVKVAEIVAFKLKARAAAFPEILEDAFDVDKRVRENRSFGAR